MKKYDIIIIGSGPAGVMSAFSAVNKGMSVLLIEKGKSLPKRKDLVSGWFGQALFKMNYLDLDDELLNNPESLNEVFNLIKYVYPKKISFTKDMCEFPKSLGAYLASFFYKYLSEKIDIMFNTEALKIEKNETFIIHTTKNKFKSTRCIVATGKNSIDWLNYVCSCFEIKTLTCSMKVGVRVEVPTFRVKNSLIENTELKELVEDTREDSFIGEWEESNILSAFGYNLPDKKTAKTSFMLGTEVSSSMIKDIQIINVLSNDKIKIERVEDYMKGKSVLKHISSFNGLKKSFEELDKHLPLFINYATMYVPEVKLKGSFPVLSNMKTEIEGLYGVGECTSRVCTLIGAMASGLIAIKTIEEKL